MKRISKTKRLKSYIELQIAEYNNNIYPKNDSIDFECIENLERHYDRIYTLVLALNIVIGKPKYYIESDAEYGSMIALYEY